MKSKSLYILLTFCFVTSLFCQTIAEKKRGLTKGTQDLSPEMEKVLGKTNLEVTGLKAELRRLYQKGMRMHERGASPAQYRNLLSDIRNVKEQLAVVEQEWALVASENQKDAGYALWHQPDTTLGQLVMDFGSTDAVYLIPQEISDIPITVSSQLPIPKSFWPDMLEVILNQNGIGIRTLNPYVKQLYQLKDDGSQIKLITNNPKELAYYPEDTRACFVITPEPTGARRTYQFLEQFINPNTTLIRTIGRDILLISEVGELLDLIKISDFISLHPSDKDYKVVTLSKVDAEEMSKILSVIFDRDEAGSALTVIPLGRIAKALFLVGTPDEIRKAEEMIHQVEGQVGESAGRVIYWYTVKHSDPDELAAVLERIYLLMMETGAKDEEAVQMAVQRIEPVETTAPSCPGECPPPPRLYDYGYYLDDRYLVDSDPDKARRDCLRQPIAKITNNFVVDAKSNAIVMVVEADLLPRFKEIVKKLDVPKKMVQLEVLLFEKKLRRENQFGLNLLRLGTKASQTDVTALAFNDVSKQTPENLGVLQFCVSRACGDHNPFGGYDLAYRFLLSQEDVQINANPSVVTVNQTPAIIRVEEEISVNTGIFEIPTEGTVALKDSFARARYGIKIEVTPTIHLFDREDAFEEPKDYVTLDTDIIFETIQPDGTSRPPVTRRHVVNTVRVADGETVILGGLRRKNTQDVKESIPFLGEIPGLGKLFSQTNLRDDSTEMFIFITPKIIIDPSEDLERIRAEEMCRRPGDIPAFMRCLVEAQKAEKNRLLHGYLNMLFGRPKERFVTPHGWR